jgi:hypothetical protein
MQHALGKHEKDEINPKANRKQDHKTKLKSSYNNSNGHAPLYEPSTATCMVLTIYHLEWKLQKQLLSSGGGKTMPQINNREHEFLLSIFLPRCPSQK